MYARLHQIFYWLRDRIYPAPEGAKTNIVPAKPEWIMAAPPDDATDFAYEWFPASEYPSLQDKTKMS